MAAPGGKADQPFHLAGVLVREDLRSPSGVAAAALGGRLAAAVLPREQPIGQREIRQECQALAPAFGQYFGFGCAAQQAVFVLHADETRARAGRMVHGALRFAKSLRREIGAADLAHFPFAHEFVQRAQRFRDRRAGIGLMELIQVDVVRAQSAQAVLGGLANVLRLRAMARLIELHAELAGNDGFTPPASEGTAEILLAVAFIVDVGGVEEIDAGVERGLHDAAGLDGIDAPSEVIATQAGQRNL